MIYTAEFRDNALKMIDDIGVKKTSKELHVGVQTLYKWRRMSQDTKERQENMVATIITDENMSTQNESVLHLDLKRELEEQKRLNQICQQTIEYLVEENTSLRQQCENYLQAISLISR